jgi:H+-translocating NAD(P) transhydrogenase subunit beta
MFNGEQGGLRTDEPNVPWVPVVLSLINTYVGLSVAVAGFVLDNTVMVVAGVILVGSARVLVNVMARR